MAPAKEELRARRRSAGRATRAKDAEGEGAEELPSGGAAPEAHRARPPGRRGRAPGPPGARSRGVAAIRREARLRELDGAPEAAADDADGPASANGAGPEDGLPSGARDRLIAAATALLPDLGYEALTVTAVRERAELSTQAFYDHFADKRALVAAVYGTDVEQIDLRLRSVAADESPLAEALAEAFEGVLEGVHRSPSTPRGRLVDAMIEIAGSEGFEAATLPRLCEAAGLTRGIFYRSFTSRRDCLVAAHGVLLDRISARLGEAVEGTGDPCERARLALAALCDLLASEPGTARIVLVEASALTPSAHESTDEEQETPKHAKPRRLADLIDSHVLGAFDSPPSPASRQVATGGVIALLRTELVTAGARALPSLAPELAYAALHPILGPEAALAEAEHGGGVLTEASGKVAAL